MNFYSFQPVCDIFQENHQLIAGDYKHLYTYDGFLFVIPQYLMQKHGTPSIPNLLQPENTFVACNIFVMKM